MARDVRLKVITDVDDKGLDKAARKLDDLGDEATQAARKILELKAAQVALGREFLKTQNVDALKQFRQAGRDVKTFEGIGKMLAKELEQGGDDALASLGKVIPGRFGDMFAELPMPLQAALVAGVSAALPAIGAAVNAGVLLGAGGGALATGLVIATKDQRVQDALSGLKTRIGDGLEGASVPFVHEWLTATDDVGAAFDRQQPRIARMFADIAPEVHAVEQGLVGMAEQAMPGLERAVHASQQVFDDLGHDLPQFGAAVGVFFDEIAAGAPGATLFLRDFMTLTEAATVSVGGLVSGLSDMYAAVRVAAAPFTLFDNGKQSVDRTRDSMQTLGTVVTALIAPYTLFGDKSKQAGDKAAGSSEAFQKVAAALKKQADAASYADTSMAKLSGDMTTYINKTLAAAGAADDYVRATKGLSQSLKDNHQKLTGNSDAALANRDALRQAIGAAERERQAQIDAGGSVAFANARYLVQVSSLANVKGASATTRAEIRHLIAQYLKVPGAKVTKITAQGVTVAIQGVDTLRSAIYNLKDKTVTVRTRFVTDGVDARTHVGAAQAHGGIIAAASGYISPGMYDRPTILFAEAGSREAFIPQHGISQSRGRALVDETAKWYGGRFTPNGGGADADAIAAAVANAIAGMRVELDGYQVGRVLGTRADLYARGG